MFTEVTIILEVYATAVLLLKLIFYIINSN